MSGASRLLREALAARLARREGRTLADGELSRIARRPEGSITSDPNGTPLQGLDTTPSVSDPVEMRMARARRMGFDTDYPVWHGTRSQEPIREFNASERGRFGPGVYFSEQRSVAQRYGDAEQYVIPTEDQLFDAMPRWNSLTDEAEARIIAQLRPHEAERLATFANWYKREGEAFWEALRRSVDAEDTMGADARAAGVIEAAGYRGIRGIGDGQETVIFAPSSIRSPRAAFDPARSNSSDLLAGLAVGVPAGGLTLREVLRSQYGDRA